MTMIPACRPIWRRPALVVWGGIDLVVISVVVAEVVWACVPHQPDAPASVIQWGNRHRENLTQVGDLAPPFRLMDCGSEQRIELADFRNRKPVALIFGSYTCPLFRSQIPSLNELYARYNDRAAFFLVYIREAHPEEVGHIPENDSIGRIPSPKSSQERVSLAQTLAARLDVSMPILLDNMANDTATDYDAWPDGMCLVDEAGRIAFIETGSSGFDVPALANALDAL